MPLARLYSYLLILLGVAFIGAATFGEIRYEANGKVVSHHIFRCTFTGSCTQVPKDR